MVLPHLLSQPIIKNRMCAAPEYGTAIFYASTNFQNLLPKLPFSESSRKTSKRDDFDVLLPEIHYFHRDLAKWPPAIALIVEGQITTSLREVKNE